MAAVVAPSVALAQATAPAGTLDVRVNDLRQLSALLNDPSADARARDEAAKRLVSRSSAEARQAVLTALNNAGNRGGQIAAARALVGQLQPDTRYIDPLFGLLGADRQVSDAAGQALASYKDNPAVANRLVELAQNPQIHSNARAASIEALGSVTDKRAAKALVDLTSDTTTSVRNAAADALTALTGIRENGRDVARWQRWWAGQAGKSDAVFRDELLVGRSARLDETVTRVQQLADAMQEILTDAYRGTTDPGARETLLLKWMGSGEPQVRLIAARFVVDDFRESRPISTPVKEQLRNLVGDSSAAVRLQVARTIGTISDPQAFTPLVTQLSQEPVPDVRAAIASVLGQLNDARAVPDLVKLLDDDSLPVAESASEAIAKLGLRYREVEPVAAREVARKLRQVFDARAAATGGEKLRENTVEALVPLKDPDALRLFMGLLKANETERVRKAALRGITVLEDPNAADVVHELLKNEPIASVRVEAVKALSATSKTEHLPTFWDLMTNDKNAAVQQQAWEEFARLLPQADVATISKWATIVQRYPDRQVLVLKVLEAKLQASRNPDQLALTRENIGQTLIRIKAPPDQAVTNAAEAAGYFRKALDHHREKDAPQSVTTKVVEQYIDALLIARNYVDAARFAGELMAVDKTEIGLAGKFKVEAERLKEAKDYANALKLIEEARKIQGLPSHYLRQLQEVETEISTLSKQRNGSNGGRREAVPQLPVVSL